MSTSCCRVWPVVCYRSIDRSTRWSWICEVKIVASITPSAMILSHWKCVKYLLLKPPWNSVPGLLASDPLADRCAPLDSEIIDIDLFFQNSILCPWSRASPFVDRTISLWSSSLSVIDCGEITVRRILIKTMVILWGAKYHHQQSAPAAVDRRKMRR